MKKLVIMISMIFLFSFVFGEEVSEKAEKESEVKTEEIKKNAEKAQKNLTKEVDPEKAEAEEEAKEEAEEAAEEKAEQEAEAAEEKAEQMQEAEEKEQERFEQMVKEQKEKQRTFQQMQYEPIKKEKTKEWHFIPIDISVGTSLQVGLTVAQLTHKNFELRIARFMLGPGFTFGSNVDGSDRDKFVPGLTFLGEISVGKFFGNPLKESCFGILLGIGSKIIFDIRNIDDEDRWEDGFYYNDPLYVDFLPLYLTYRHRKGDKFYDFSLRIPLVWQNGVYVVTDETRLYNGVPDITLNFSFVF